MRKPGIFTRAKYAVKFFREGYRNFQLAERSPPRHSTNVFTWAGEKKAAPFIWPEWRMGEPIWSIIDYRSYAQEGFNENSIVYSAIMYKVKAITAAPLRAYSGTFEEPELLPADHPLAKLVARPNRYQSWSEFQGLAEVYFNLSGNCYIYMDRDDNAMYLMRPDLVKIVPYPGKKDLMGFLYIPEGKGRQDGIPFLPQDIIHIRLPNPLDPLDGLGYGLSPLSPAARSANVDNQITKFLKLFFEKGAMPPGLLRYSIPLQDADVARMRERWQEQYGGMRNWTDIAVLDETGEYQRLGLTFDEMGFETLDERSESRICGPFGVPPILIGTRIGLNRATLANYELAWKAFWQDTMIPELRWFETDYQYYLQGERGEFVMFDLSKIPALMPTAAEKEESANAAFLAGGITRNEYRAALGMDPIEGGDVYLIPFNRTEVQIGQKPKPVTEEGTPEAEEEAKSAGMTIEQKAAFWKQLDTQARRWEKRFADAAKEALENDKREVLSIVNEAKTKALENKQTVTWGEVLLTASHYFMMEAAKNWRKVFIPILKGLILDRGEQLNADFGMEFDVQNLLAQKWFDEYTITFAQPINDTTEKTIRAILKQGMEEGWSIDEMSKNLETTFRQWMEGDLSPEDFAWFEERMPKYRRETIARTETIKASNAGSNTLYKNWGVMGKEWLATMDDRVRDTHAAASGQIVGIDEKFEVGGHLMQYPGDPTGPAEEIINCRCSILPVF